VHEIHLRESDIATIEDVLSEVLRRHQYVEDADFLAHSGRYVHQLPERLRFALHEFRLNEPDSACRISGFTVVDDRIGDTPPHWADSSKGVMTRREDFYFALCATALGDIFGWASQQGGRLVHEVLPIRGHEDLQINSASSAELLWHTEDAFHPYRADYVGLMCLRNPDHVGTTLARMQDVKLDTDVAELLFQPRFVLKPDEAHLPQNRDPGLSDDSDHGRVLALSYARIQRMLSNPEKVGVLFGDPASPYIRLDSDAVDREVDDPDAMAALGQLMTEVDKRLSEVTLEPGDVLFLDNFRAVHGRVPFKASFDGRDRWLKRLNVTRDLRRSRDARVSTVDRIVY
jgi:Fe(II)/alpha-ketoglutarate-dependent arginine beta-hydroxylase